MKQMCAALLAAVFALSGLWAQSKYALVIGNSAYRSIPNLSNPVNDATDMEAALLHLGFQVELVKDGSLEQMEAAVVRLRNRLSVARDSYGFFFYAGHGVQSNGSNYLIPVDAAIQSEAYLRSRALEVQIVLDELQEARNELNVIVLDACRDNPFGWSRGGTRGLTVVGNQPQGSLIVYATSAGKAAADGSGRNGLFTTHLLNNLKNPGLEVYDVFRQTSADVSRESNKAQVPEIHSQFFETAWLGGSQTATRANTPEPATVTPDYRLAGYRETALGDLVADATAWYFRDYLKVPLDFAIQNSGAIKADLPGGKVTKDHARIALPLQNFTYLLTLKGSDVIALFQFIATIPQGAEGFPLVSKEVRYTLTIDAHQNGTVSDLTIGGKPVDPERVYKVATSDYLAAGGDGYTVLKRGTNPFKTAKLLSDMVVEYAETLGQPVKPRLDGRITLAGAGAIKP